ncbi:hypothetical protein FGO68_gene13801 [Halteria grandinella]|uniref:Uncharacterized protein n=1 Tax=Halteria grandinella TaxID=5974 RepID=A0A8J8T884_HALGN|nr:hypothetical protein FGO68_gene13801 [Halteria grandinella]
MNANLVTVINYLINVIFNPAIFQLATLASKYAHRAPLIGVQEFSALVITSANQAFALIAFASQWNNRKITSAKQEKKFAEEILPHKFLHSKAPLANAMVWNAQLQHITNVYNHQMQEWLLQFQSFLR